MGQFISDASGDVGFGINMGPMVIHGTWTESIAASKSIGMKELYPLVVLSALAGDLLAPFTWSPTTDNLPNVFGMLKGHSNDKEARPWLASLLALQSMNKYLVIPGWCPRRANQFMDDVSKVATALEVCAVVERYRTGAPRAASEEST